MKPNFHRLLSRCIEEGLATGFNRAHKHTDTPASETITDAQYTAIMNEIDEWFIFEGVEE